MCQWKPYLCFRRGERTEERDEVERRRRREEGTKREVDDHKRRASNRKLFCEGEILKNILVFRFFSSVVTKLSCGPDLSYESRTDNSTFFCQVGRKTNQ